MRFRKIPGQVLRRIRKKFFWKTVVFNVNDRPMDWPAALVYFVTDAFNQKGSERQYIHTTDWESVQLARVLDGFGFRVDVVDRAENEWLPDDTYALVVGNAAGNSGRRYPEYCGQTPSAKHVFYARGAHTDMANGLSSVRYEALRDRTGFEFEGRTMRVMEKVDFEGAIELTDAILTINGNGFTADSYRSTGKPVMTFTPPSSPMVGFDESWLNSRDKSKFFCFAGSGFVRKGIDLIVEAFLEMPELTLTIAGPGSDALFWDIYGERISRSPNIDYIGFIDVAGSDYADLCGSHAWTILAPACEGVSTAIATNMRSGLVPVVTYETGVRTDDFGFLLPSQPDEIIESLKDLCPELSRLDDAEYEGRVRECVDASNDYTESAYIESVTSAFEEILRPQMVGGK